MNIILFFKYKTKRDSKNLLKNRKHIKFSYSIAKLLNNFWEFVMNFIIKCLLKGKLRKKKIFYMFFLMYKYGCLYVY